MTKLKLIENQKTKNQGFLAHFTKLLQPSIKADKFNGVGAKSVVTIFKKIS
ncbi:hypothetical protein [Nostoc sp.]|uniref:hypothetical protein n=1 Tax=Nostoc sp. TaxID=1180 RepID=UPI002FF89C21